MDDRTCSGEPTGHVLPSFELSTPRIGPETYRRDERATTRLASRVSSFAGLRRSGRWSRFEYITRHVLASAFERVIQKSLDTSLRHTLSKPNGIPRTLKRRAAGGPAASSASAAIARRALVFSLVTTNPKTLRFDMEGPSVTSVGFGEDFAGPASRARRVWNRDSGAAYDAARPRALPAFALRVRHVSAGATRVSSASLVRRVEDLAFSQSPRESVLSPQAHLGRRLALKHKITLWSFSLSLSLSSR